MKVLALCGSPRGDKSETLRLTRAVVDGAAAAGAEVELVDVCKLKIEYCIACQACYRDGRCIHDDDYRGLLGRMLAADGLVFASPDYFRTVSAQMKTVIDRMSDAIHCQLLTGKYACSVATSGGPACTEVTTYLDEVLASFGAWVTGHVAVSASSGPDTIRQARQQAELLGRDLAEAIASQRRYPEQEERLAQVRTYFMQLVGRMRDTWVHEAEVWSRLGWT
jgi:multimeric flavodoxin WrbA